MSFFGKKPTAKEQMKATEKVIKKSQRDMTRERNELERQEKRLQEDIKKAAKTGNKQAATILAKQLVQLRKQKDKTYAMSSRMGAIGTQQKLMASNMKMAEVMGTTSKTMGDMNKLMDPQKTAQTMQQFERENAKMEMTEEVMNDALDDILNESGDEEEQDAIVTQVCDIYVEHCKLSFFISIFTAITIPAPGLRLPKHNMILVSWHLGNQYFERGQIQQ